MDGHGRPEVHSDGRTEPLTGDHLVTYEGAVHDDVASTAGRDLDLDEPVFRALADAQRRILLDRLFERDGQTLGELCAALPHLTRFGVMKHLGVLEHAWLVTTRRDGRHKLHFLNPVPIRASTTGGSPSSPSPGSAC